MLQNPDNQGKSYCKKCQTFYSNAHAECPFCGTKKDDTPERKFGPSPTDLKLVSLLRPLSDHQKQLVVLFIENNF